MSNTYSFDEDLMLAPPKSVPAKADTKTAWEPSPLSEESQKFLDNVPVEGAEEGETPNPAVMPEQSPTAEETKKEEEKAPEEPKLYTDDEKFRYVQATCGGQRFTKEYTLFDGRVRFTFRESSPAEDSAAIIQIRKDSMRDDQEKMYKGQAEYFFVHETYLCLMALAKFKNEAVDYDFKPMFEVGINDAKLATGETVLTTYAADLTKRLFPTSALLRLVLTKYREFVLMTRQLDLHATEQRF